MTTFSPPTRKMIDELFELIPASSKTKVVEQRAQHAILSAINFIKMLEENYSSEEAEELTRKFLVAIKAKEPKKFSNKLRNLSEDGK